RTVRRLHDGAHLMLGDLRVADRLVLAGDAARDADFDQVGALLELHAHHFAELGWPVRLDRPGEGVAVTTGGDARHARGEDPRAERLAGIDRRLQREVRVLAFTRQA